MKARENKEKLRASKYKADLFLVVDSNRKFLNWAYETITKHLQSKWIWNIICTNGMVKALWELKQNQSRYECNSRVHSMVWSKEN